MRRELRAMDALMVMGKNTLMKAAIAEIANPPLETDEDYEQKKADYVDRPHLKLISD